MKDDKTPRRGARLGPFVSPSLLGWGILALFLMALLVWQFG